jgi:hypothetical protein
MATTGLIDVPPVNSVIRRELWFARALRVLSALSVVCVLCFVVTMLRARHELTPVESIVGAQSSMLARDGTLYYGLKDYPYTVCAYMPIFYFLEAAFARLGAPVILAGRLVSFLALLASFAICWRIVMVYTENRYAAWIAMLLASSSALLLNWGTTAQVDMLAVTLSIAGFYQFSRYYIRGENTLFWAGLCAALAFFTKQTMLAAPAAMFVLLLVRNRKTALLFGSILGGSIAVIALAINAALSGRFFGNTVFANINPFDIEKLFQHLQYFALVPGALVLVLAAALSRLVRGRSFALVIYFGLSTLLFLALAGKVGSDFNYQLEATLLLIICVCAGLVELNFFELCFRNSKSWVTLLQVPLGVFLLVNYRMVVPETITRSLRENFFRTEMAAVEPYIRNASGRVFSTEPDPLLRLRGELDIEPLIYGLLVRAGRIDPEPLRRDLSNAALPLVILHDDIFHGTPDPNLEIGGLQPVHLAEVRQHYRLVNHIPGPYLGGIYVYQPIAARTPQAKDH